MIRNGHERTSSRYWSAMSATVTTFVFAISLDVFFAGRVAMRFSLSLWRRSAFLPFDELPEAPVQKLRENRRARRVAAFSPRAQLMDELSRMSHTRFPASMSSRGFWFCVARRGPGRVDPSITGDYCDHERYPCRARRIVIVGPLAPSRCPGSAGSFRERSSPRGFRQSFFCSSLAGAGTQRRGQGCDFRDHRGNRQAFRADG